MPRFQLDDELLSSPATEAERMARLSQLYGDAPGMSVSPQLDMSTIEAPSNKAAIIAEALKAKGKLPAAAPANRAPAIELPAEGDEYDQLYEKGLSEIAAGQSEQRRLLRDADMSQAGAMIGAGIARTDVPDIGYDQLIKRAGIPVNIAKDKQKLLSDYLNRKMSRENTAEYRKAILGLRNETRAAREEQHRKDQEDKYLQKLSGDTKGSSDALNSLKNVEQELGFSLDNAEVKNGKVMVGGKEVDLPGVSLPGVGRVTAYSGAARSLQQSMQKMLNIEIKDRSGTAVTTPEMQRIKTEFGLGKFNSEAELVKAMKDYKAAIANALKNTEAGYDPNVVSTFKDRGGVTSSDFNTGIPPGVRQQRNEATGQIRWVYPDGRIEYK